jgi:D-inositol-3-phosphate glycosyltransferase
MGYGFRLFEWCVYHLSFSHYICDSHFTRDRLVKLMDVRPSRTSVVYPAVDYTFWDPASHRPRNLKAELGLDTRAFVYLYFGRPGVHKGLEYLIDAASQVRERLPSGHLVLILANDPPDQYWRLRRRIARAGLTAHVTVLDPVPREQLPGYLLAADCVVVPSISEGFGYAAVEAATLGCPVISTTGHSVQEVLGDCVDLVPPRDSSALAEAVIALAGRRPAPRVPRRFDVECHIAGVEAVYRRLAPPLRTADSIGPNQSIEQLD